jgi:ABC-2 type transport system ATP-binding protein
MITLEGVTKTYGDFTAVDDVSFVAQPGRVTGFLGPNGAGKSTSMRIMVGLTPADRGTSTIGGLKYHDIPNPGRHVGVLLDASAQHAGRTGREVLALSALTMGLPESRVEEMLTLVGLSDTEAKRRVKNYSLGMRQRLGIANALMGDPSVLILDEPANGLDPAGIHWMRSLLRSYAERGGTVLLSSHLLHEVEMIADELVLIGHGRIVAQGTKAELLQTAGTYVKAEFPEKLAAALAEAGIKALASGDGGLRTESEPIQVGRVAAGAGLVLSELRPAEGAGLEELFLELTGDTARERVTAEGVQA